MKILLTVESYWPSRGGCQEVVRQLARRLARRGHDVTVATSADPARVEGLIDGVRVVGFEISGNEVSGYRGDTQAYVDWVRDKKADVILNYSAQVWPTDLLLPVLPKLEARKVLVPCGYSMLRVPRYRDYYARLPALLRGYDRLVHLSDVYRDAEFAREHGLSHAVVIPNGCGADECSPGDREDDGGAGESTVPRCRRPDARPDHSPKAAPRPLGLPGRPVPVRPRRGRGDRFVAPAADVRVTARIGRSASFSLRKPPTSVRG